MKIRSWQTFDKKERGFFKRKDKPSQVLRRYGYRQIMTHEDLEFYQYNPDKGMTTLIDNLSIKEQIAQRYVGIFNDIIYRRFEYRANAYVCYEVWIKE